MRLNDLNMLKMYEKNNYSQFGEDGVIEEIFNRIKPKNKICIEFGAWDGEYLSNTYNLWHNQEWSAILIEKDEVKYKELLSKTKINSKVKCFNYLVTPDGEHSLDGLFKNELPKDIDLLSVDIDGDEYYILENLNYFRPRLIIIEYNPTIPPHLEIIQEKGEYFGASALALVNLAHKKNYKLLHLTTTNIFLVSSENFDKMEMSEPQLSAIFPQDSLAYLYTSYDGKAYISNNLPYLPCIPKFEKKSKLSFLGSKVKEDVFPDIKSNSDIIKVKIFKL